MKLTPTQIDEIPTLIEQGRNYREIGLLYGCGERTIAGWVAKLRKAGLPIKVKRGVKALEINKK